MNIDDIKKYEINWTFMNAVLTKNIDLIEVATEAIYNSILQDGDVSIDLGGHLGRHTLPMARKVSPSGKVLSFECVPQLAAKLRQQAIANDLTSVIEIRESAISDIEGECTFYYYPEEPGLSSLLARSDSSNVVPISCSQTTLAASLSDLSMLRFLKADIEGAEYRAFVGGKNIINKLRPLIVFENGRQASADRFHYSRDDFFDLFESMHYDLYSLLGFKFSKLDWDNSILPWQFIAAPREDGFPKGVFLAVAHAWLKLCTNDTLIIEYLIHHLEG